MGPGAKPTPLVTTSFNERSASVSPDGRWLLFQSNSSGGPEAEAYVRTFPDTAASLWPVSSGGGSSPKWSVDGREIFYESGANELMRIPLVPGPRFAVGKPRAVLSLNGVGDWDVAADGRIIFIRAVEAEKGGQLIVVEDFFDELRRKVPNK